MKKTIFSLLFIFMTGCISATLDNYSNIDSLCQKYYDDQKCWPVLANDLMAYEKNNKSDKINWSGITEFSIEKISDHQIRVTYSRRRWYGNDSVTFSVFRPVVNIKENNADN